MSKSVLRTIIFTAIAALVAAGCNDSGTGNSADVNTFLSRFSEGSDNGGGGEGCRENEVTLTVKANPSTGGTVFPTGTVCYPPGMQVNLTATASSGYYFTGWSGAGASPSANNPIAVTMSGNMTITANFGKYNSAPLNDSRGGGQTYNTVTIGSQTWMAENLNYNAPGSKCGGTDGFLTDSNTENCDKYGRLYDWATVMNGAASSTASPSGVQGICPSGWHVPSDMEWDTLVMYVDPDPPSLIGAVYQNNAGTKLKSVSGWDRRDFGSGNGTNEYGFSALPGGYGGFGAIPDQLYGTGSYGSWWSATEDDATGVWGRNMSSDGDSVGRIGFYKQGSYYSLRCLKD